MDGDLAYCEYGGTPAIGILDQQAGVDQGWDNPALLLVGSHPITGIYGARWYQPHSYPQYKILIHIPER